VLFRSCVWCKAGAIPSACYTTEQSQKLPAGVFTCDVKDAPETETIEVTIEETNCHTDIKDEATCNAASECVWCSSGAIPSSCYSKDQASRLPPGVFVCGQSLVDNSDVSSLMNLVQQQFANKEDDMTEMGRMVDFEMDRLIAEQNANPSTEQDEQLESPFDNQSLFHISTEDFPPANLRTVLIPSIQVPEGLQQVPQQVSQQAPQEPEQQVDQTKDYQEAVNILSQALEGILTMAVSGYDTKPLTYCLPQTADAVKLRDDLNVAVEHLSHDTDVVATMGGLQGIGAVLARLSAVVHDCGLNEHQISTLKELAANLQSPKDVSFTQKKKIVIGGVEMHHEITSAVRDWQNHLYGGFGFKLGNVLGRMTHAGVVKSIEHKKPDNTANKHPKPHMPRMPHPQRIPRGPVLMPL